MRVCSFGQLCLTLCDPIDCSPPGFSALGISQASTLEWVPISPAWELCKTGIESAPSAALALAGSCFTAELPGKPRDVNTLMEI